MSVRKEQETTSNSSPEIRDTTAPDVSGFRPDFEKLVLTALLFCKDIFENCAILTEQENVNTLFSKKIRPLTQEFRENNANSPREPFGAARFTTDELLLSQNCTSVVQLIFTCMHEAEHFRLQEDPNRGSRNLERVDLGTKYESRAAAADIARAIIFRDWLVENRQDQIGFDDWMRELKLTSLSAMMYRFSFQIRNYFAYIALQTDSRIKELEALSFLNENLQYELQASRQVHNSAWSRSYQNEPSVIARECVNLGILMDQLIQLRKNFGTHDILAYENCRVDSDKVVREFRSALQAVPGIYKNIDNLTIEQIVSLEE